jgi:hypothetical protein
VKRVHYNIDLRALEGYDTPDDRIAVPEGDPSAVLVSSELADSDLHAPALDIDFPCRLVPSSTDGHFHLFIDVEMTWDDYERLLAVLADVGVIEPGYHRVSAERRATHLRLPHIRKEVPA